MTPAQTVRVAPRLRLARPVLLVVCLLAAAGFTNACGDDGDSGPKSTLPASTPGAASGSATPVQIEGEIVVLAASSLTDAFKAAGAKFSEQNPKAKVTFSFASSSALATQINEGAPADIFASADAAQMKLVTDKGNASGPVNFATNLPTIVVPKTGSPVASFADLAKPGVRLVLAGPEVPVGKYARDIFTNASRAAGGVSADFSEKALANLKSNEANVRAVLTKVQLGEADAGVVYTTDAATALNDVRLVEIPTAYNVIAQYPIAATTGAKNSAGAKAWLAFILSPDGQAVLAKYGFGKP